MPGLLNHPRKQATRGILKTMQENAGPTFGKSLKVKNAGQFSGLSFSAPVDKLVILANVLIDLDQLAM